MKLEQYGGGRRLRCATVDEAKLILVGVNAVAQKNGHEFPEHRNDRCVRCGALIVRLANDVYVLPKMVAPCQR